MGPVSRLHTVNSPLGGSAMVFNFSFSKFVLFVTATVVGGLAQVWLLYFVLLNMGKEHDVSAILGDGGLYFFATSLTASSALVYFEHKPTNTVPWDWTCTILAIAASMVSVAATHPGVPSPFRDQSLPQITCAAVSFVYSTFVAQRTGYFAR
jgi:hypothetical protein